MTHGPYVWCSGYHAAHRAGLHVCLADGPGTIRNTVTKRCYLPTQPTAYAYDSFGQPTASTTLPTAAPAYAFTGREWDAESETYFYRARHYDARTGRFTGEDPLPDVNLYAYVKNNPVKYIDPYGMSDCALEFRNCLSDANAAFSACMEGARRGFLICSFAAVLMCSTLGPEAFPLCFKLAEGACIVGYTATVAFCGVKLVTDNAICLANYIKCRYEEKHGKCEIKQRRGGKA
ncbi:MAG: RHS repeat-associated core domain-containing protein [Acidobacteriota bacterium]